MLLIPTIATANPKPGDARISTSNRPLVAEPLHTAERWIQAGARRLHVADVDGVTAGKSAGADVIRALVQAHPGIALQVSGAVRDGQAVEKYLAAGAEYVMLDAKAARTPHLINDLCLEFPGHILLAMEARHGKVAADGGSKLAQQSALDAATHFQREGVAGIVLRLTDAERSRDDYDGAQSLAQALTIPVLVNGGLNSLEAVASFCRRGAALGGAVLDAGFAAAAAGFSEVMRLAEHPPAAE
ncbi:MAG: 1-(5-phosphoribosyl)-5-((5-phosphoribosylamino)methylideneamino)imidazole-4-carboxamide isomerase [Gammaproteobacteria bacterium]|nr:1-(5-phosphoribosyl)-5-((5-phosphoribosylamino)methylideneamino)imidazole-4-carboxamide isomerase [Gammaproteobacteria bacterium]MDE1887478.1 1-(5-phosphoribosyl)-5-((5-phosphoribosylamino)methylideneamino)imidazole-4-carboxamide isomerase [Gammaproteobacteria bacterium]MDE2023321.1 1-(5-phosphoribosyl)-5-((5-phosphoribosylamino)methylideneamino)imidazole-4-carboxamide isomerase [Gammaproteobacteria bacterium]MDE2140147.1 1-(5-phosphoribosyl)-5-((5-phosphoribosylamino)methylideneamino)imidazo